MAALYEAAQLSRIHRTRGAETPALTAADFTIEAGVYTAITGPSGSGKSTLLNLLGFLDRPSAGQLLFKGHDTADDDADRRAWRRNRQVGFVFQTYRLLSRTSARENVELPMAYSGIPWAERRERAEHALERVGLSQRLDSMPSELSGGEQQRVAIARALVNNPEVILADEPTGALDTATGEAVLELLLSLVDTGLSLVIVTHSEAVAARATCRIRLRDGRVVDAP